MSSSLQPSGAREPARPMSASRRWLNAIELTARLDREPRRLLCDVIAEHAEAAPDAPALLGDAESMDYGALCARINAHARFALAAGVGPGDTVALVMTTRPDYFAIWAGISAVGGVVALVNTQLRGAALAHALKVAGPAM